MNTQVKDKLGIALIVIEIIISLNSCTGQEKRVEECKADYNKAKSFLNAYYQSNEPSLLNESLSNIEKAMKCEETKRMAIDIKISLMVLLKEYQKGYKFIDSLTENDFNVSYKKSMNHDYLLALEFESKGDTISRNKLINKVISDIQKYLEKEKIPGGKTNEEAYYLLFMFKSKILSNHQVKAEIESLKKQYPEQHAFLDVLIENFKDTTLIKESHVIDNN